MPYTNNVLYFDLNTVTVVDPSSITVFQVSAADPPASKLYPLDQFRTGEESGFQIVAISPAELFSADSTPKEPSEPSPKPPIEALLQEWSRRSWGDAMSIARRFSWDPELQEELAGGAIARVVAKADRFQGTGTFAAFAWRTMHRHMLRAVGPLQKKAVSCEPDACWDHGKTPDKIVSELELREIIAARIDKLPPHYQAVVRAFYFDGDSQEKIAADLQIPVGTVKSRLFKARELLQNALSRFKVFSESTGAPI